MRTRLILTVCLLLVSLPAWAAMTFQQLVGTTTTLLSTQLNALASNGFSAASSTYDNRIGQTGNGYTRCRFEAAVTFTGNPAEGGAILVWLLKTVDGTNFENTPTSAIRLQRQPDVILPATTGTTATRVSLDTWCPAERFQAVVRNDGTGAALTATGHTLKIMPITLQGNP